MVILDLSMPGMDGIEVCRELRTWYTGPIIVLSVRGSEADKIAALDTGADDYLTKPFSAGELLARVRAHLRRAAAQVTPTPVITVGDLEIDIPQRRVRRGGEDVDLTRIEFDILAYLAQHPDCVVTQEDRAAPGSPTLHPHRTRRWFPLRNLVTPGSSPSLSVPADR
jgi:two-component system KDP operon response regulator KdpE